MAPTVFVASRPPDPSPAWPASSASSADDAGKAIPSAIVTGRTTRTDEPTRATSVSNGWPGVGTCGATRTKTRPASASAAAMTWLAARSRTGSPRRVRRSAKMIAPMVIPKRNVTRIVVKTYVVLPVPDARRRVHATW